MNPLLIRRRGMMAQGAPLPDGQLEWIETDGVAYINTGYNGRQPRSVKLKTFIPTSLSSMGCLIGCEGNSNEPDSNKYIPVRIAINPFRACFAYNYYYTGGSIDISQLVADGKIIDIYCKLKPGSQILGAKEEGAGTYSTYSKTSSANIQSTYTMYVFACNRANAAVYHCWPGTRILELTIYSDFNMTTESLALKPWRLNGEVGLMDTLTYTFHGNAAGSGAFTGGPNVI